MWILPKQLHTCHSVQVMTESESDLKEFYQTCEQSLMWRSKPSQSQTWFRRWRANSWMQHLSTRMLRPSHTKSFVEEWTSYQEVSLANPSAKLELKKELKTLATSIPTSVEESKNVNQELFSSKTLKELSAVKQQKENQFSTMCLKTWKDWVTKQRQEYSLRVKSASLIREKESSLWAYPTPRTSDAEGGRIETIVEDGIFKSKRHKSNQTFGAKLRDAVESFPTPMAEEGRKISGGENQDSLTKRARQGQLQNYPTPQVDDSKNVNPSDKRRKTLVKEINTNQSQDQTNNNTNGKNLVLNPSWVEQLMGLQVGWTDCVFLEME